MIDMSKPLFISGVVLSSMAAAMNWSLTLFTVPNILLNNNATAISTQWLKMYNLGVKIGPVAAGASALSFFGNAYLHYHPQAPWRARNFIIAGGFNLGFVVYTVIFLKPTNDFLMKQVEELETKKTDDTVEETRKSRAAVEKWGYLNAIRGFFPFIGALVAFEAL